MYSHVTFGHSDFARSRAFDAAVMGVLGHPTLFAFEEQGLVACGDIVGPKPFIMPPLDGAYVRDPDGNKIQGVCHRSDG